MRRTDAQRLEHFCRRFDLIAAEPALGHSWAMRCRMSGPPGCPVRSATRDNLSS